MSVELPDFPGPARWRPQFLDFSVGQDGGFAEAGPTIRRLGNRWRVTVMMPNMRLEPQPGWGVGGRVWLARLRRAITEGARLKWYQQGFQIGLPGAPVLDAAVLANTDALPLSGLRPGYIFREGQFFNVVPATGEAAGIHFLHTVREETVADGAGEAAVPIGELLRIDLAAGDPLRMDPIIEGKLVPGQGQEWESDRAEIVAPEFTLTEYAYGEWF